MRGCLFPALALPALAIAACASTPPPEPVKVAVPVKCIHNKPTKPIYPQVTPDMGLFERVQTLLVEREMRIAYEGEMEAVVSACD